jgi:molecular chaperone DnaJ
MRELPGGQINRTSLVDENMGFADNSLPSPAGDNHYAVLGVEETASLVDIRRAYRRLALRYHPDKAGAASKPAFIRISVAYRVLSNSIARAEYDTARLRHGRRAHGGELRIDIGPDGRPIARHRPAANTLPRLTGTLAGLVGSGALRVDRDGALVLRLDAAEAATGGTAAIELPLTVRCPTCGGISRPGGVWCRTCDFKGSVVQPVTVFVPIPEEIVPGVEYIIPEQQHPEVGRSLRFRFERG